jgi:hypothetical protein
MYQHDWELLDRQMSHLQPTSPGLDALAFVGLFLAGMTAGAFLFAGPDSQRKRPLNMERRL